MRMQVQLKILQSIDRGIADVTVTNDVIEWRHVRAIQFTSHLRQLRFVSTKGVSKKFIFETIHSINIHAHLAFISMLSPFFSFWSIFTSFKHLSAYKNPDIYQIFIPQYLQWYHISLVEPC